MFFIVPGFGMKGINKIAKDFITVSQGAQIEDLINIYKTIITENNTNPRVENFVDCCPSVHDVNLTYNTSYSQKGVPMFI